MGQYTSLQNTAKNYWYAMSVDTSTWPDGKHSRRQQWKKKHTGTGYMVHKKNKITGLARLGVLFS